MSSGLLDNHKIHIDTCDFRVDTCQVAWLAHSLAVNLGAQLKVAMLKKFDAHTKTIANFTVMMSSYAMRQTPTATVARVPAQMALNALCATVAMLAAREKTAIAKDCIDKWWSAIAMYVIAK
mmetsp:Transcript_30121/g.59087  ORF Transcript_30121/g.59087 Transcript_30121/m.59087 type:complete len:122 (+) Transcript_30121:56-421(+)